MKRVAIIGAVGVPASYGGFETLIENIIGDNCSPDVEYTVFCSSKHYYEKMRTYKRARLKYINLHANGVSSILYDGIALMRSLKGYDTVVSLGVSGAIFMPIFRLFSRAKLITNIDGLEWKRDKWRGFAKFYLRLSEEYALRFSHVVIADNQGIVDYVKRRYKKETVMIAYGGDHVVRSVPEKRVKHLLSRYHLAKREYAVNVCRIEPENNCDLILQAFSQSQMPLVMIGNWDNTKYGRRLKDEYSKYSNINLLDAIYDLDILYILRSNARLYIHGHSAGGTNPSLVEAMFCGCDILAYDVIYNRESTNNSAKYFKTVKDLLPLLLESCDNSGEMLSMAHENYCWRNISMQYESLY